MSKPNKRSISTGNRLIVSAVAGIIAGGVAALFHAGPLAVLIGFDVTALVYLITLWRNLHQMSAFETSVHAVREDPTIPVGDAILIIASVASLVGEGVVVFAGGNGFGITIALISVVLSWVIVHTTFMLRYARLYYSGKDGGIAFNQPEPPTYHDFAYFSFTIGMTYQVSDTVVSSTIIRRAVLRQALLSYLFGAVILASTVNIIAGLSK